MVGRFMQAQQYVSRFVALVKHRVNPALAARKSLARLRARAVLRKYSCIFVQDLATFVSFMPKSHLLRNNSATLLLACLLLSCG